MVVPIINGPGEEELQLESETQFADSFQWLAWPLKGTNSRWVKYFKDLLSVQSASDEADGAYLTIGTNGRVRGSNIGRVRWDVILSTFPRNRPGEALDEDEKERRSSASEEEDKKAVLQLHKEFYDALVRGDNDAMAALWNGKDMSMEEFSSKGARLDNWETVLRPDRRPEGLAISDADCLVRANTAWVTSVETVPNGSTLLATQTFRRDHGDEKWKLVGHRTVPYGKDIVAKVVLRCDSSGCMALPARTQSSYRGSLDEADKFKVPSVASSGSE
eukprot:gnl/TRDRNA2_/TRDRNA2_152968_c0_seq3.p1 gnl/TRDRNA2_/TRDRNA2_152968_c0~~gnl/TRDRNA2_/TRDRNA2_152968_c0_seq3.p1  ORF type:complete len:316 (-),score=41.30 gnl/TRDRNA2_/TRDRNA2_152968_c0_seq3:60-884(-)